MAAAQYAKSRDLMRPHPQMLNTNELITGHAFNSLGGSSENFNHLIRGQKLNNQPTATTLS
jgi:hypothetical protein